jgi:hypothetical protein
VTELLFVGGTIWTGTGERVSAVAVADGRIVGAGPRCARPEDRVDHGRRPPDAHSSRGSATGTSIRWPAAPRAWTATSSTPPTSTRCSRGWPPTPPRTRTRPGSSAGATRRRSCPAGSAAPVLDAVVADRPVALWSSDHHMVWCNTARAEVAGITAATPDPPRGTIVRDDDGHPVGTLLEEAELLLEAHLPPRDAAPRRRAGSRSACARMATAGLVVRAGRVDAAGAPAELPAGRRRGRA